MKTLQNFINGKSVSSSSDKTQDLINPATGQVFAKAPVSNAKDIDDAMKSAEKAFETWRDSTPGERQKAINKIADSTEQLQKDYEYSRGQLYSIIEKGQEALSDMLQVAQRSQSPRAFEVVSDLVKTLSQTNKDLLELMKQKKIIENSDGPKTVNNNLFVGSTTELLKLMKKQDE